MSKMNESELLKSLDDLEEIIAKGGDALAAQPHDGGFATEGTNIQSKAKAVKKALEACGLDLDLEKAEAIAKMLSASDMGSDEGEEAGEDDSAAKSTDDGAEALAGAMGDEFAKALVDEDEEMSDMIDASDFLKSLVNETGARLGSIRSEVGDLAKAMADDRATQEGFNSKIAKALVLINKSIEDLSERYEQVANTPVPNSRSTTVRKSDIAEPPIRQGGVPIPGDATSTDYISGSPLLEVPFGRVQEALINKAIGGKVSAIAVTEFENQKDFSVLPKAVFKALEEELC